MYPNFGADRQPMSMVTIDTNWRHPNSKDTPTGNKASDLLTLRILEASEKKMRLIKKLLSPEEYEAVVSSLFELDSEQLANRKSDKNRAMSSVPPQFKLDENYFGNQFEVKIPAGELSKVDQNLRASGSNLHETLASRKEALEFFFANPDDQQSDVPVSASQPKETDANLAIELRSCYQFQNLFENRPEESVLISEESILDTLTDKFWALLSILGFEREIENQEDATSQKSCKFIEEHKRLNCHPYTTTRNLLKIRDRLTNDKQLASVPSFLGCKENYSGARHEEANASSEWELYTSNDLAGRLVLPFGDFHRVHLMRAKSLNELMKVDNDELLRFHHLVEIIANQRQPTPQSPQSNNIVDKVYSIVYNDSNGQANLLSREAKFSRLINRVDTRFLLDLLGVEERKLSRHFMLDPFECKLVDKIDDSQLVGRPQVRAAVLAWRWVNNLTRLTVHLSERENYKICQEGLAGDAKSKVTEAMSSIKNQLHLDTSQAHIYIERLRLRAIEFVRNFERHFETLSSQQRPVMTTSGPAHQQQHHQVVALKDLLREPQIKLEFSGVAKAARRLIPHKTARRPLMPRRKPFGPGGKFFAGKPNLTSGLTGDDLEAPIERVAFRRWHQFAKSHQPQQVDYATTIGRNMRLVVTIQQANNVPMRVHQQQMQQVSYGPSGRPISPSLFQQQSSLQPLSFSPFGQRPLTPTTGVLLLPATTYVEVVFQRQQQTSSLVQGNNPTWNETLFFPVAQSKGNTIADESFEGDNESNRRRSTQSQQLIDECLQLNLYDYNCYTVQDNPQQQQDLSTLVMSSTEPANPISKEADIGASRLVTSSQRIERHLLGSLRVPLSAVLSNGRIEGSFALNQPLLLENYQFEQEMQQQQQQQPVPMSFIQQQQQQQSLSTSMLASNKRQETYVSLFITLDPPVTMPMSFHLPLGSYEGEQVLEYVRLWERILLRPNRMLSSSSSGGFRSTSRGQATGRQTHQVRHLRALVLQSDARYCIVTRLLFALQPPKELIEDNGSDEKDKKLTQHEQMRAVARFVSLLSPLKYGLLNVRLMAASLWFNSAQLINRCLGGPEEKAVLLCNYFLYMGKCSAILLGDSVPEGRCVFVIVWHEQSRFVESQLQLQVGDLIESISGVRPASPSLAHLNDYATGNNKVDRLNFVSRLPVLINYKTVQLWDPISGKSYSLRDQLPLISVGSIATLENVYANMNNHYGPISEINFDIRLRNCWFPLFESTSATVAALPPVVSEDGRNAQPRSRLFVPKNLAQLSYRKQLIYLEQRRKSLTGSVDLTSLLDSPAIQLNYRKFSQVEANKLRDTIEKAIKTQLLNWRPGRPTYFNRTLSRLLADKLSQIEKRIYRCDIDSTTSGEQITDSSLNNSQELDWRHELATTIREDILAAHLTTTGGSPGRQVVSWPVNVTFTSMRSILDSLYASGVHDADLVLMANPQVTNQRSPSSTLNTQFLVACHVEPFPARLMSVWLYVAAVVSNGNPTLSSNSNQLASPSGQFLSPSL